MNKNDITLILIVIIIALLSLLVIKKEEGKTATIYYNNDILLKVDLNKNENYVVKGYNGDVNIEVKDHMIRVIQEESPLHLCSKQGYISNVNESIVCLPNKIVVKIDGISNIDAVTR